MLNFNELGQIPSMQLGRTAINQLDSNIDGAESSWWDSMFGKSSDWGMEGKGGVALGAGKLGLGLMGYLENKKTAGKQRALLDQQIKQNKYVLNNAKGYHDSIRKGFGNIQTQGA